MVSLLTHVIAMERRPYWRSHIEANYCTYEFGAISQRDLRAFSVPCDSPRNTHYERELVHAGNSTHNWLAGLAMKKSGGTITLLHR